MCVHIYDFDDHIQLFPYGIHHADTLMMFILLSRLHYFSNIMHHPSVDSTVRDALSQCSSTLY